MLSTIADEKEQKGLGGCVQLALQHIVFPTKNKGSGIVSAAVFLSLISRSRNPHCPQPCALQPEREHALLQTPEQTSGARWQWSGH